jgi:hypothetical protein
MGWYKLDRSGSGYEPVKGSSEYGNELSGYTRRWGVLE